MSKNQIVRWAIAVLCILFVPVCGSPISVVLLLGAAITVAPVEAIQQHLKKPLNIIPCSFLCSRCNGRTQSNKPKN